jgi:hypothetical protein
MKSHNLQNILQDDGPNPVVEIRYTDEYRELMDLFRAVVKANEMSERALALTAEVVESNPANYTAWQYRRECLKALGSDLRQELRFSEATAYDNPKNYQIWFHRRAVRLSCPSGCLHSVPSHANRDLCVFSYSLLLSRNVLGGGASGRSDGRAAVH